MAKQIKAKKISVSEFERISKEIERTDNVNWCGNELIIKKFLSLSEAMNFVQNVVDSCFDNGVYRPELKAFAIKLNMINYYSNLSLPSNFERSYEYIYTTDICQTIKLVISGRQYDELIRAIDEKISSLVAANTSAIHKQASDIIASLDNISSNIGTLFENLSSEDITAALKAIPNMHIDEKKLIEAYKDASHKKESD